MSLAQTIAKRMLERRRLAALERSPVKPPSAPVRVAIAAHKGTQAAAGVGTRVAVEPQLIFATPVNFRAGKSKPEIIREREPEKRTNPIQPRVVSAPAGHKSAPYNPLFGVAQTTVSGIVCMQARTRG